MTFEWAAYFHTKNRTGFVLVNMILDISNSIHLTFLVTYSTYTFSVDIRSADSRYWQSCAIA